LAIRILLFYAKGDKIKRGAVSFPYKAYLRRIRTMTKSKTTAIAKGIGITLAVGSAAAVVGTALASKNSVGRKTKKKAAKVVQTVSDVVGNLHYLIK
jgi:hypothetical protein